MNVTPYVFFNGNCAAAIAFYEKVLGARVQSCSTYGASPMKDQFPPETHDKVIHAHLVIGTTALMLSDDCRPNLEPPGGYSLTIGTATVAEAKTVFEALADGGTVTMKFGKTFFAEAFGAVHDRFGVRWMVIAEGAGA
jgi:PhnB protein